MQFPELGFYALPGHVHEPKKVFHEIDKADELGLGSVWLAERLNTKEVGVLSGIAAAKSQRMGIASGLISNLPLRNPLVVAGYASTMAAITDNRFALGIGRGIDALADRTGTARLNFKLLEDYIGILRRLWRGESVHYEGPAGTLRGASLGMTLDVPPPIIMGAMGAKTAYWSGQHCDGVVLNSLWSTSAVRESVKLIRQGAKDAGRNPKSVKVWAILMAACEVSEEVMLQTIIRRINTYVLFPPLFDGICDANGWDRSVAVEVRKAMAEIDGVPKPGTLGDEHTSREIADLRKVMALYPTQWIREGCAAGSAEECAPLLTERFEAGADGILFHGTTPDDLAPLLRLWRKQRPVALFEGRSVNPGL
jgi:5,10-methylenetetrahydromethanopterin reductase